MSLVTTSTTSSTTLANRLRQARVDVAFASARRRGHPHQSYWMDDFFFKRKLDG
jgi:hypothetical protein